MRFLITSGGTRVPVDDVRDLGNFSSGRTGAAMALAVHRLYQDVTFLHARDSIHPFRPIVRADCSHRDFTEQCWNLAQLQNEYRLSFQSVPFKTFAEYEEVLGQQLATYPDVAMLAVAGSDYGPIKTEGKISSSQKELVIQLFPLPKLIQRVKKISPSTFLVGFKLLVNSTPMERYAAAMSQIEKAGSDMVLVNDLAEIKDNHHTFYVYDKTGYVQAVPPPEADEEPVIDFTAKLVLKIVQKEKMKP